MPQLSLPEIKLSELGDRIGDATDDLPEDVRDRLSDVGERISDAGARLGSEVGERLSDFRWPGFSLPAARKAMPEIRLPSRPAPNVRAPRVDLPHLDSRDLRRAVARLDVPSVTIGKRKAGPPIVPIVILAAVGGAFLGWWLATSSYTSGQVRALLHDAKVRLGFADRPEDGEDRSEDFWADQRRWQPGEEAGSTMPTGPGGSISGEDGSLRAGEDAGAMSEPEEGATSAPVAAWPNDIELERESERDEPVASAWTEGTGGIGSEPDGDR